MHNGTRTRLDATDILAAVGLALMFYGTLTLSYAAGIIFLGAVLVGLSACRHSMQSRQQKRRTFRAP